MKKEILERFINKQVRLATPHKYDETRIFHYYGKLIEVNFGSSILESEKYGVMAINNHQIISIQDRTPSGNREVPDERD